MNQSQPKRLAIFCRFIVIFLVLNGFPMGNKLLAEVIFQGAPAGPAGPITNSIPELDVQGGGWRAAVSAAPPQIDAAGHLFDPSTTTGGAAGVRLIPNGPYGSMTLSAQVNLAIGTSDWVGLGFDSQIGFLTDASTGNGPWFKISATGDVTLYGGSGQNQPVTIPSAFTNSGTPIAFSLTYDAYFSAATVTAISGGTTNILINALPLTNTLGAINPLFAVFQFPTNAAAPLQRWIGGIAVDWIPRPRPLLQLPTPPPANVIMVGAPTGGSDIALIKSNLDAAAACVGGAEVRFNAGATYIISNNVEAGQVPLTLASATNVLVNGNGCRVLIKNPYIGFLEAAYCTNVIMQGFTVDYDPLPFTQGVVISNLAPSEASFLFQVDAGYPAPTNANYTNIANWGIFMDPTRPGRLADGHSTIYDYTAVTSTATSNIFKVRLKSFAKSGTFFPGDLWCQLARYNGSSLFRARFSSNVTFLNLTVYTGAAAAFAANNAALVNEINCNVIIGPSPGGTNGTPRRKTTNADGGFFTNPRIGPWVEGNNFIGLSDDVANANILPFYIHGPIPSQTNTFHLEGYNPAGTIVDLVDGQMVVGDDISFYNGTNGVVFARAFVTAIDPPFVTFDRNISSTNIFPGKETTNTCIFDNSVNTSAVYLNNKFSNSRIHGIYCRANNILIAHNFVTGMGSSAIAAYPALSLAGPNSFIPTNAVIMDNVLQDGGFTYDAMQNTEPTSEPSWALLELHKATANTDMVTNGTEISGIRILNNAFLQWRRTAITLHNVSDCVIAGNYFGPPADTNASGGDLLIDLWVSDYNSFSIVDNFEPGGFGDTNAIGEDFIYTTIPGAFRKLTAPHLTLAQNSGMQIVSWTNAIPGFVLQQSDALVSGWIDTANTPYVMGRSNIVTLPIQTNVVTRFYRARQR